MRAALISAALARANRVGNQSNQSVTWLPDSATVLDIYAGLLVITDLTFHDATLSQNLILDGYSQSTLERLSCLEWTGGGLEMQIQNFPSLQSISCPKAVTLTVFSVNTNPSLTYLSLPLLETVVGGSFLIVDNAIETLSFESLQSIEIMEISEQSLTSLLLPSLETANGLNLNCNYIDTLDLSSLTTVLQKGNGFGGFIYANALSITSLSLPALTTVDLGPNSVAQFDAINFDGAAALADVSMPALTSVTGGDVIFTNCALNAASVNHILARLVVCGFTGLVNLSGGTSAAPTGQGITDAATLTGNGATVTTN